MDYLKNSDLLKALGHPVRLQIIEGLLHYDECNVNKIVDKLNLPQSTVSQHLKILKNQGIIIPRNDGVKKCYRIIDDRVFKIIEILRK